MNNNYILYYNRSKVYYIIWYIIQEKTANLFNAKK